MVGLNDATSEVWMLHATVGVVVVVVGRAKQYHACVSNSAPRKAKGSPTASRWVRRNSVSFMTVCA